ncbi:hypothetical protein [Clostridium tyrobutyricum]|nr:hypothetical protein [Clostridium tyrobutyricum]
MAKLEEKNDIFKKIWSYLQRKIRYSIQFYLLNILKTTIVLN